MVEDMKCPRCESEDIRHTQTMAECNACNFYGPKANFGTEPEEGTKEYKILEEGMYSRTIRVYAKTSDEALDLARAIEYSFEDARQDIEVEIESFHCLSPDEKED